MNYRSIFDYPFNFEGVLQTLQARLFQNICFMLFGNYVFISDQNVNAKCNRDRDFIFFIPFWNSKGHRFDYFLVLVTSVRIPPQTDTLID